MRALALLGLLVGQILLANADFEIDVQSSQNGVKLKTGGGDDGSGEEGGWSNPMVNIFNMIKNCCGNKEGEHGEEHRPYPTRPPMSGGDKEPWILMAGGSFEKLVYTDMELYSMDPEKYPVPKCLQNLRAFPNTLNGFAGGSLTEKMIPTMCGSHRYCYQYDAMKDMWESTGRVSQGRLYASHSCHPEEGLIMVGGGKNHMQMCDTVESTNNGKEFRNNYNTIPQSLMDQCQVTVGNQVIVLGGQHINPNITMSDSGDMEDDSQPMKTTSTGIYVMDVSSGNWSYSSMELPRARQLHSCGVVSEDGVAKEIVVVGGDDGMGHAILDTDILDMKTMAWRKGKSLPHAIDGATTVQYGDSFVIIGGVKGTSYHDDDLLDTVFKFDPETEGWKCMDNRLKTGRYAFAAFQVKMESFPECH